MPAACCGGGGEGDGGCEGGRRDGALRGDWQWEDDTATSVPLRARLHTARGAMVGAAAVPVPWCLNTGPAPSAAEVA